MADMGAIASVAASFKALKDIAQTMVGLRDAQVFQAKMIEFQDAILDAQNSLFAAHEERSALIEQVRDLEKQMADFKAWEAEKQRYQLIDFGGGTFAYVLKEEASGSEPPHRICAACYQKEQKSILQFLKRNVHGQEHYVCPACKNDFNFGARRETPRPRVSTTRFGRA